MADTIFALSSGSPPAAIAVVRISGPNAGRTLTALAGRLPAPRTANLRSLYEPEMGDLLDRALVLWFPGPESATGEDLAEVHLHGGRAVVAGVTSALAALPGLREATPGEFTRRAFFNGRLDLAEVEGLADLLTAETQHQRRAALALAGGAFSREVEAWREDLMALSAQLEAQLDFSDEADVSGLGTDWYVRLGQLHAAIAAALKRPSAERLRDGVKVAIAGPPNAGKSTLFNALAGREAAITSPVPGTTRDLIEAPVEFAGIPFVLIDTAGLRVATEPIEAIGVRRAQDALVRADIVLWLGLPEEARQGWIRVRSKIDVDRNGGACDIAVSAATGEGLTGLADLIVGAAATLMPVAGEAALHRRHREALADACFGLSETAASPDPLVQAEGLNVARSAFDRLTGRSGTEDLLDAVFGRFCIGK